MYADIGINTQWSIDSDNDNTDLFSSLIGRSDQGVNFTRNIVTEYDQHYNILVRMANEHGFVIHDVIGNGDCLFNAIAYQIDCSEKIDGPCLRAMTVEYLRDHPYFNGIHQGNFVCDDIADPSLPVDLRWEFYLTSLPMVPVVTIWLFKEFRIY